MDKLIPTGFHAPSLASANTLETLTEAKKGAARLLGCYRTGDANDPEVYITGVVAVLSRYSIAIIREVTEPATGLASKSNWLPTIAEIRKECDVLEEREKRKVYLARQLEQQFAEREKPVDRSQRPSYEDLRAKHDGPNGEKWGLSGGERVRISSRDQARKSLIGQVGQAAFDAIPDNPAADYHQET